MSLPRGLSNLASFCYCNSVLQQFFRLPLLREYVLSFDDEELLAEESNGILHELRNIFVQLSFASEEAVDSLPLADTILDPRPYDDDGDEEEEDYDDDDDNNNEPRIKPPRTLDPDLEMDVSEFLSTFLTQLSAAEERWITHHGNPRQQRLRQLIQGQILNEHYQVPLHTTPGTLTERVSTLSSSVDQFFYISLNVGEVPNRSWTQDTTITDAVNNDSKRRPCVVIDTLEQSLAYFCSEERINCAWAVVTREGGKGPTTDAVCTSTCCRSTLVCETLPAHLLVHLKRFRFDHRKRKRIKLHDRLEFPMLLDVAAFTSNTVLSSASAAASASTEESSSSSNNGSSSTLYELSGVIVHRGSASKGHYYSLVRNRHTRQRQGSDVVDGRDDSNGVVAAMDSEEWFKIDDAHVTTFDHNSDMDAVAFGGQSQSSSSSSSSTSKDNDHINGNGEGQPGDDIREGQDHPPPSPPKAKKQSAFMLFYDRIDTPRSAPCS